MPKRLILLSLCLLILTLCNIKLEAVNNSSDLNLLSKGAIITGSSFRGAINYINVSREHYFDKLTDGEKSTFWMPMDEQNPQWLEARWRCPLKISRLICKSENIVKAELSGWIDGKWQRIGSYQNNDENISFPLIETDRLRLAITKAKGIPKIFELEAYGPQQPVPPEKLPLKNTIGDEIIIRKVTLSKKDCRPGDKLKVGFELTTEKKLSKDYYFIVEIREKQLPRFRSWAGDFELVSVLMESNIGTSKWLASKNYNLEAELRLPAYSPAGEIEISIMGVSKDDIFSCPVTYKFNVPKAGNVINIIRNDNVDILPDYPRVEISNENGQKGFKIGKQFFLPFFMRYMRYADFERFYKSRLNNIDLQYFLMYWSCVGTSYREELFKRLEQQITSMLRVRPNSYFLIGIDMRPSKYWLKANPNSLMLDANGKRIIDPNCSYIRYGAVSFGSEKYEKACREFIDALFVFLKNKPYAGRIIGWQPWTNTTNDAFIGGASKNQWVKDRNKILVGDYHPGAIKLYRNWLRKKYNNSVVNLRKAWNDPKADFATATPSVRSLVAENAVPGGVFRDPSKNRAAFDYIEFFPSLIGGFHQRLAAYLKKKTNNKALVFMHYGAILDCISGAQPSGRRIHINNNDLPELLKDKNIDMFVQAQPYPIRHSGMPFIIYQPVESINLHGKMYLSDYDPRTFATGLLNYGRHRSVKETQALIYRDLSFLLIRNSGAWLADMCQSAWNTWTESRNSWFARKEITQDVAEVLNIFKKTMKKDTKPVSEIAIFISTSTPKYEDILNASNIYNSLFGRMMFHQMPFIGAPYDVYLMSDISNPKIRKNYKLYIFLNSFFIDKKQRKAIESLKSDGRTLMWFYAPGYVDKEKGLTVDNISTITGINTAQKGYEISDLYMSVIKNNNPIFSALSRKSYFVKPFAGKTAEYHPSKIWPVFYVNDSNAETIAEDKKGKPVFVVKKFKNWNSVYSVVPYLECDALRSVARFAGVHLYSDKPVIMSANNRLLVFNNGYSENKELNVSLPTKSTVVDAVTGKMIVKNKKSFKLKLACPETRILRYE